VRKFVPSTSSLATLAGTSDFGGFSGDGFATSCILNEPQGIALDGSGNVYFSDTSNHRVRRIDVVSGMLTTVVGTTSVVFSMGFSGDGGQGTAAKLKFPYGLRFYAGHLYIADTGNNRVRRWDPGTGIVTTVAGGFWYSFHNDGEQATNAFLNSPRSVAFDGSGNMYIADSVSNRIRIVDSTSGVISTIAGNGFQGVMGDGGPATLAELNFPTDVAISGTILLIVDSGNNKIRQVDLVTRTISTFAGSGEWSVNGNANCRNDLVAATSTCLNNPTAIALDGLGNVYVSEVSNYRVRVVSAGHVSTVVGEGWAAIEVQ
jgi:sugar lactone lactonase YvrE